MMVPHVFRINELWFQEAGMVCKTTDYVNKKPLFLEIIFIKPAVDSYWYPTVGF